VVPYIGVETMSQDIFSEREYERRVRRVKQRLREEGLDAVVVADPANMNYLTGYDGWSFYVHQAVVVAADREVPVWIGREMDANGARATTALSDSSIRSYSDDHVHSPHDLHPMDYVAGVLEELDVADGDRTGDGRQLLHREVVHAAHGNLPEANFVDTTLPVNWVRVKKSDRELEYMRQAARISENAMQAGLDAIEAGVPEYEVAAEIYDALIRGRPARRRLPGHRPADALWRPHRHAPPDLDRPRVRGRRPGHHRALGLSPPLPLATRPDDVRRRPTRRCGGPPR